LYLLHQQPSLDAEALQYTEMAQHEVARVSEITQQTLRFYRQSTLPVETNLREIIDSVLLLHQGRVHTAQVTVTKECAEELSLFALSGEMRQLMANLIGNSLDAMGGSGGNLVIRGRKSQSWVTGEPGVRLTVADTGCGMDPEVRKRIFEPFFTTKEATGTGLGMWVSWEIVGKHEGTIRVRSRVGEGTVFMLFFPENGLRKQSVLPSAEALA
jgi:signal transduction histidine kinase